MSSGSGLNGSAFVFLLVVVFIGSGPVMPVLPAHGQTFMHDELHPAATRVLAELDRIGKLDGARIAVMGFTSIDTEQGCREFSIALANQMNTEINEIKSLAGYRFFTVPRHGLDALETEYLLSRGGSEVDIIERLDRSDLLITGLWHDQGPNLVLTIKAVSLSEQRVVEYGATSVNLPKAQMPVNLQMCFADMLISKPQRNQSNSAGPVQRENLITVKGFGAANTKFPKSVWKKSAEEAAILDAQARLLELINGSELAATVALENHVVSDDRKVKRVNGWLRAARKVGRTTYPTEQTAEVIYELDLASLDATKNGLTEMDEDNDSTRFSGQ